MLQESQNLEIDSPDPHLLLKKILNKVYLECLAETNIKPTCFHKRLKGILIKKKKKTL